MIRLHLFYPHETSQFSNAKDLRFDLNNHALVDSTIYNILFAFPICFNVNLSDNASYFSLINNDYHKIVEYCCYFDLMNQQDDFIKK